MEKKKFEKYFLEKESCGKTSINYYFKDCQCGTGRAKSCVKIGPYPHLRCSKCGMGLEQVPFDIAEKNLAEEKAYEEWYEKYGLDVKIIYKDSPFGLENLIKEYMDEDFELVGAVGFIKNNLVATMKRRFRSPQYGDTRFGV